MHVGTPESTLQKASLVRQDLNRGALLRNTNAQICFTT